MCFGKLKSRRVFQTTSIGAGKIALADDEVDIIQMVQVNGNCKKKVENKEGYILPKWLCLTQILFRIQSNLNHKIKRFNFD